MKMEQQDDSQHILTNNVYAKFPGNKRKTAATKQGKRDVPRYQDNRK